MTKSTPIDPEKIFWEIHSGNPREGPGCFAATKRAFERLSLPKRPRVLDIGCGPGRQTQDLASLCDGRIFALDLYRHFLGELKAKAEAEGFSDRIDVIQGDMAQLPFQPESFDLIWAEGSIYIIGFQRGLKLWRPFLKSDGFIAVTEVTWLKTDPPRELSEFWQAYPAMTDTPGNTAKIRNAGYTLEDQFVLPPEAWWDDYYSHIAQKIPRLRAKYGSDQAALDIISSEEVELEMHRKYADYYGYMFYVMRKT
jgi:ubiquinone/menaquinone biosynthesis C-methylase UbiE